MTARDVLRAWLTAWEKDDRATLGRLFPPESILHATEPPELAGDYRGLQGAADYFRRKADLLGEGFRWEAGDILEAGSYAVIPFKLLVIDDDLRQWWQVALYRVVDDHIAEAWLFEESPPAADGETDGSRGADDPHGHPQPIVL